MTSGAGYHETTRYKNGDKKKKRRHRRTSACLQACFLGPVCAAQFHDESRSTIRQLGQLAEMLELFVGIGWPQAPAQTAHSRRGSAQCGCSHVDALHFPPLTVLGCRPASRLCLGRPRPDRRRWSPSTSSSLPLAPIVFLMIRLHCETHNGRKPATKTEVTLIFLKSIDCEV